MHSSDTYFSVKNNFNLQLSFNAGQQDISVLGPNPGFRGSGPFTFLGEFMFHSHGGRTCSPRSDEKYQTNSLFFSFSNHKVAL